MANTQCRISWTGVLKCADIVQQFTNLDIDKYQDNTEVLPILGVLECGFSYGVSQFRSTLLIFNNCDAIFL